MEREHPDWWYVVPNGSVSWGELESWGKEIFRWTLNIKLPLEPKLPKSWRTIVNGRYYGELWLRYYAAMRFDEACMVLCSDYANHMTYTPMPIVRDRKLDLKLQLAHAQLQHWVLAKKRQRKKGQNSERTTSKRLIAKAMAGGR